MTSHVLPEPVKAHLTSIAQSLEEVLQADSHLVRLAIGHHAAFDESYIESMLTRALLVWASKAMSGAGFGAIPLPRGGVEFYIVHEGIEWRFRLKSSRRDRHGFLDVRCSSDSVPYAKARALTLWDDAYALPPAPHEPWVLAFRIDRRTLTFAEVCAAEIVGVGTAGPPFRLEFADDIVKIDFAAPVPPPFPEHEEGLEWHDDKEEEDDGGAEATG